MTSGISENIIQKPYAPSNLEMALRIAASEDENLEIYGPHIHHISWDMASAKKGGYDYFMMKEIHEQPEALRNTIRPRIVNDLPDFRVFSSMIGF